MEMTSDTTLDMMLSKYGKVILEYRDTYGSMIVTCCIYRRYCQHLGTYAIDDSAGGALTRAQVLMHMVQELERTFGDLKMPNLDVQKNNGGYWYEKMPQATSEAWQHQVAYRRHYDHFLVSGISRIDNYQFTLVEEPYAVPDNWVQVEAQEVCGRPLAADEALYAWDTIRHLSGSRGYAVVKNGLVMSTKSTAMA